jgi:tetratricopeptide (TPR) repeat protein
MPALHGDLADHEPAFPALKELIETGTTDKLPAVPPASRGVPTRFELHEERSPLYPDSDALLRAALGKAVRTRAKAPHRTRVRVVHGNLAFARYPVMVGHYQGDTIVSAEAHLDHTLGGRLRERFRLHLYPGPIETEAVFLDPRAAHVGAVVIGLGVVGELSPGELARAVSHGARAYAVARSEATAQAETHGAARQSLSLSVLMIGTGAGGLSIDDAVTSMLRGITNANQILMGADNVNAPRIDEIEFIELYEDRAIQAVHALRRAKNDAELSHRLDIATNLVIESRRGSRRRVSFAEDPNWWQRLQIHEDAQERLAFHLLTDRARTQAYLQPTQRSLVDGFIRSATGTASTEPAIAVTLFEMLIPNALKDRAPEQRDLVLLLNDAAARYPWELMQERPRNYGNGAAEPQKPVAIQAGMLRQLQVTTSRQHILTAQGRTALVVGDPPSNFVPLPGAVSEAKMVKSRLEEAGYEVVPIIRDAAADQQATDGRDTTRALSSDILRQLYAKDYRILHLAGHGVYEFVIETNPKVTATSDGEPRKVSGMVIGKNHFLTAAEIHQMRVIPELIFINCCHLGHIEDEPEQLAGHFPHLAANLATELIRMGVRGVIAAGWAVDDQAAQRFAEVFYGSFLSGVPFGEAVHEARKDIFTAFPQVNTWGAYQCYGDPSFALAQREASSGTSRWDFHFAAPSEAIVALHNLAEDATTQAGNYSAAGQDRVRHLLRELPDAWQARGDVQAALGKAFGELGMFSEAIEHYRHALAAEAAQVPIEAGEQMCNLMVRQATHLRDQAKAITDQQQAQKLMAQAQALFDDAKPRLTALIQAFGETAERCNLLGSIAKREALWATSPSEQAAHLEEMRKAYKRAESIIQKRHEVDPYPLLNWLTADTFLVLLGKAGEDNGSRKAQLDIAAAAAMSRDQHEPKFWDAVSVIDAELLTYISDGTLTEHAQQLIDLYLTVKRRGSPREFRSVVEHLDFLIAMAALGNDAGQGKRVQTALGEIKHGIMQQGELSWNVT